MVCDQVGRTDDIVDKLGVIVIWNPVDQWLDVAGGYARDWVQGRFNSLDGVISLLVLGRKRKLYEPPCGQTYLLYHLKPNLVHLFWLRVVCEVYVREFGQLGNQKFVAPTPPWLKTVS
jgi:hypothetical protein